MGAKQPISNTSLPSRHAGLNTMLHGQAAESSQSSLAQRNDVGVLTQTACRLSELAWQTLHV